MMRTMAGFIRNNEVQKTMGQYVEIAIRKALIAT